jgi:AP-1 complex subunit sigma 1/2
MCVDAEDNELETLEIIHHYVEILDRYFGNVSWLNLYSKSAQAMED